MTTAIVFLVFLGAAAILVAAAWKRKRYYSVGGFLLFFALMLAIASGLFGVTYVSAPKEDPDACSGYKAENLRLKRALGEIK